MHCRQRLVSKFRLIDIEGIKAHISNVRIIETQWLSGWDFCKEDGISEILPDLSIIRESYIATLQPFLGHGRHAE